MARLPSHLRFLEEISGARHRGLAAYFPDTAKGMKPRHRGERVFWSEGIGYLGDTDGSMVPIEAEHLEPITDNTFDAAKFSALVDAIKEGRSPVVYPGYADLSMEGDALEAQVRDGNHRVFAPIALGASGSWVMMSDSTKQDLNEAKYDRALYRAIRAAQREHGAPVFERTKRTKVRKVPPQWLADEKRIDELNQALHDYYVHGLRTYGKAESGFPLEQQVERPQIFWRMRMSELAKEHGHDWVAERPEMARGQEIHKEREAVLDRLRRARAAAGLKSTERLDPATGKVALQ